MRPCRSSVLAHDLGPLLLGAHVVGEERGPDLLRQHLALGVQHVGDDDLGALGAEQRRLGAALAAGATRDDRHLAVESPHEPSSVRRRTRVTAELAPTPRDATHRPS